MIKRWILSWLTVVMLVIGMAGISGAVPVVSYTNTYDSVSSLWTYETTIFNDTADILFDVFLNLTVKPLSAADMTAAGWGTADIGTISPDYFVHWMADFGAEIPPADTMSGFWFIYSGDSDEDIGSLSYSVLWGWDTANDAGYLYEDSTISAAPVPEPATWSLMASGLIGSLAFWRKTTRRRQ